MAEALLDEVEKLARAGLLEYCQTQGIRCVPFESFDTVKAFLEQNVLRPLYAVPAEPLARLVAGR